MVPFYPENGSRGSRRAVSIAPVRMHADQVDVTVETVTALVRDQFPAWAGRPVRPVVSHGTVNALFRLGADVVLRFPLQPGPHVRDELVAEQRHARMVAAHVPLAVPEPLAIGEPGPGYPGAWAAYRWIDGKTAGRLDDPHRFARDLAAFVRALHGIDTGGHPRPANGRGGRLRDDDEWVRHCFAVSRDLTDVDRLARIWEGCLALPPGDEPGVWVHADLMPGNLLVRGGRLAAVIDLGAVRIGDPAVDLMPAWNLLPPAARTTYRRELGADDAEWERGRGWALVQAIGSLHYYVETNPVMSATARRTLDALLE
jgi:aminoglycoside phosphotransferase (APT) family kinase protein